MYDITGRKSQQMLTNVVI